MNENMEQEVSLYDLADWAWSYRFLALVFVVIGIAGAVAAWAVPNVATPSYRASFTIYTAGTPVRTAAEIAEILAGQLSDTAAIITSDPGANPVTAEMSSSGNDTAASTAANVEASLVAEVQERQSVTLPLISGTEGALELNLTADSFLAAHRDGLIKLIQPEFSEQSPGRSIRDSIIIIVASGALFFLIAGMHSFWIHWRRHRREKLVTNK
ncbi:hypothetical protein [Devosia sp. 2618]|uniref:hypothetical protein n=1 Tax=Devosia sp. 2618 TaxID=3156454 RepID=UPI00339B1D1A